MNSIGALWLKDGKKGKFMSGVIEIDGKKTSILVFKNTYKDNDKKPDYTIHQPEEQRQQPEQQKPQPAKTSESFDDDIPW